MPPTIRPARRSDVDGIATAHVAAWREAYRGLLPDAVLDGLSVAGRAEQWRQTLARVTIAVFVVEGKAGEIAGFISGGPRRSQSLGSDAEVYALYVREEMQRQGFGRGLMRTLAATLRRRGFTSLGLWVLRENASARRFYERLGGTVGAERQDVEVGHTVSEVAYEWPALATLVEGAGRGNPRR